MFVPIAAALLCAASPRPLVQDAVVVGPVAPVPPALAPQLLSPQLLSPRLLSPRLLSPRRGSGSGTAALAGGGPTVVLTNVVGAARATVPGLPGAVFEPGTGTGHFDRIYGHPSGHWILTALADLPTGEDECLIVDGQLALREGDPAPWTGGAENCGTIDTRCAINAQGDFTFATNTSATSLDDYVATFIGGAWGYAAREGDPVPGLTGATLDDVLDSPLILDDGRVGYAADGVDGAVTVDDDDLLLLGGVLLMREGVTAPPGQAAGAGSTIENFDLGDFWASGDGAHWIVQGDLGGTASSDDVVIVDGTVVLQEGQPVPGSGFVEPIDSAGLFGVAMDASGGWFARGDNDVTGQDWVVRSGVVVASGGALIHPGATERWDDANFSDGFFGHVGNALGSYVVGGTTDHPDPALDAVLVMNGSFVVARESDPVDLDGDGLFNDGLFVDAFGDDDLFLTDDLVLYAVVTLKDAAGTRVGQALVRFDVDPGVGTAYCDGVPNSTGAAATLVATGSSTVALNSLSLVARQLPPHVSTVFLVGGERGFLPSYGGGTGTLCLAGGVERFVAPGQFGPSDADGRSILDVDLTVLPRPGGPIVASAGETWRFQVWYRDQVGAVASTNFSNAVEVLLD